MAVSHNLATPQMLSAGRRAFMRHRSALDDLYSFYEIDLATLLRAVYKAMDAERNRAEDGARRASNFNRFVEDAGRENDLVRQGVE